MSKVRVYEVARDLGLPNRELVQKIAALGIQVRNHMSVLESTEVDRIRRALDQERGIDLVEERIRPTVVRRRSVVTRAPEVQLEATGKLRNSHSGNGGSGSDVSAAALQDGRVRMEDPANGANAGHAPSGRRSDGVFRREPERGSRSSVEQALGSPRGSDRVGVVRAPVSSGSSGMRSAPHSALDSANASKREASGSVDSSSSQESSTAERPGAIPGQPATQFKNDARFESSEAGGSSGTESVGAEEAYAAAQMSPSKANGVDASHAFEPGAEGAIPSDAKAGGDRSPSEPPPLAERLGHANLPPGVVARGKTINTGAKPLSDSARKKIVAEHAARSTGARRRELRPAHLGRPGRTGGRPVKKKISHKKGKQTEITVPSAQKRVIRIQDQIQLQQLAARMSLKATQVLMKLMQLGMGGVHINSSLDVDTAKILASEFGYEVENLARSDDEIVGDARGLFEDEEKDRETRSPIVTVMGHVDHGKTSLLDKIRKTKIASGEAGGITQHIGAYVVTTSMGPVVFLDTPGHAAFTSMRARGAQATDVVILVVAADDGVMPQTREAVNHCKAANVPMVVAVNKIDKPDANPDTVKNELAAIGLTPEEWGGDTQYIHCSALSGEGLPELLQAISLQAELLELMANSKIPAEGVVLEAYLDKGRGPVANVLIRNGMLNAGDHVVAGGAFGRVRAMTDDRGKQVKAAGPATPVEVLGLNEMPSAGDLIYKVTDAKKAQEVAEARKQEMGPGSTTAAVSLDQFHAKMQNGDVQELKLVVKADVQGSIEAIIKALLELSTEKVKVHVIHTGVGGITENDVMLASASNAIIIGFNVRPTGKAGATAKKESVEVRKYSVIYEAVDEVKSAMAGLLAPNLVERDTGKAQVRQTFGIPKVGTVAGCYVIDGKIIRGGKARVIRDSIQIWQGDIAALRRFKDDVKDVAYGYECGISLAGFNDIKESDVIECYEVEEVAATLD